MCIYIYIYIPAGGWLAAGRPASRPAGWPAAWLAGQLAGRQPGCSERVEMQERCEVLLGIRLLGLWCGLSNRQAAKPSGCHCTDAFGGENKLS